MEKERKEGKIVPDGPGSKRKKSENVLWSIIH